MKEQDKNLNQQLFSPEEDLFLQESLLEKLRGTQELSEVDSHLNHLLDLAVNCEKPNTFPKIKGCVNIATDSKKDILIRMAIISKVVDGFFPFLNSEKNIGEIIKKEDIINIIKEVLMI